MENSLRYCFAMALRARFQIRSCLEAPRQGNESMSSQGFLSRHMVCTVLQMGQEADEETQNWLDSMMSNRVVSRVGSGARPDLALASGGPRTPNKPKPGDRAMRKTLILRAGASDTVSTSFPQMSAPVSMWQCCREVDAVLTHAFQPHLWQHSQRDTVII